jgi:hypothetical protein
MNSLIKINKKLKISIAKLDKLLGNCDEVSVDTIFYKTLANQLVGLELLSEAQKKFPNAEQAEFIEEAVALAITALDEMDEALVVAVDEHHASVI